MKHFKKTRKPRGIGKDGVRSKNMCSCGSLNCDPMTVHHKLRKRMELGLCMACGKAPEKCSCKSVLRWEGKKSWNI